MVVSGIQSVVILVALVLTPGVVAMVLWSPILLSTRLRTLFRQLPPTTSILVSYVLVALVLSLPFIGGALRAFAQTTATGAALSNTILDTVLKLSIGYIIGMPVVSAVWLPRLGIDWDPAEYGASTWLLLVFSAVWYIAVFALPLSLLSVILAVPT